LKVSSHTERDVEGAVTQAVEQIVDTFPGQSIDFFGAMRSRVYDDKVRVEPLRESRPPQL